ncbi:hypothetical protein F53441_2328 [Fusarium austroafricanum]|uniref:Uncharacterized protein n=1 Tax=Fusarium austroafricanum TaxID=2364996 RepID=A0A8H4KT97_9HYPO|nr:hypothetical protein F53441_2328 [Fusarium austroafricanum]
MTSLSGSESAQALISDAPPSIPNCSPEPPRYQVLHIQHAPGSHKIYIPTSPPRPAGYLYQIVDSARPDDPQPCMNLVSDVLASPDDVGYIHDSVFVGSIASQDLEHVCAMIKGHPRPLGSQGSQEPVPSPGKPGPGELWVLSVIDMLLDDGVLEPPPPEPRSHRLPRHHHTAHCSHQRLHSYHPYRRKSRPSVDQSE